MTRPGKNVTVVSPKALGDELEKSPDRPHSIQEKLQDDAKKNPTIDFKWGGDIPPRACLEKANKGAYTTKSLALARRQRPLALKSKAPLTWLFAPYSTFLMAS
jgi:hypothetical protein